MQKKIFRKPEFYFLIVFSFITICTYGQTNQIHTAQDDGNNDQISKNSLEKLSLGLENKMKEYQIPGLAIVVVKGNEVLVNKAFGWANEEKKIPVTDTTVFPIGSSAKPLTATLVSMLVSDGALDWDDPITDYLPYFCLKIKSDNPEDQVTLRDLLSHRTGFFHMELIQKAINWGQDPDWDLKSDPLRSSREALLKAAAAFEPKDDFQSKHNYSNIGMVAAAEASGKAANLDWDALMKKRVFEPLGMTNTTTSITQIKDFHNLATGYLKGKDDYKPVMLINMDVVSPAGGINSCARDMVNFLKLLLNGGTYKGNRLINKAEIEEMWTTQIQGADVGGLMPGASYGLGWFVRSWNGYRVVEHAGNALGYTANIALIPELGIGYVMMSNAMPTPILGTINEIVWESLGLK
jgi:CubicO group peptidase (beta-lactamase class C family)